MTASLPNRAGETLPGEGATSAGGQSGELGAGVGDLSDSELAELLDV